jgi:hypothetical protein
MIVLLVKGWENGVGKIGLREVGRGEAPAEPQEDWLPFHNSNGSAGASPSHDLKEALGDLRLDFQRQPFQLQASAVEGIA